MKKVPINKISPECISMDLEPDTVYAYLTLGCRSLQNAYEKVLLREIKKIKREGYTVDIPSNGI
jgi:hypothetical protein